MRSTIFRNYWTFCRRGSRLLWAVTLTSCLSPGSSYLTVHQPWDRIFQRSSFGGAADIIGTELNAPSFTLFANGVMVGYRYADNKRQLVSKRLSKDEFLNLYHAISLAMLFNELDSATVAERRSNLSLKDAPTTRFVFYSRALEVKGLGLYRQSPSADTLKAFNHELDRIMLDARQLFRADSVRLYVKKVSGGDPSAWPVWPLENVRLDSIYRHDISFYEPNTDENSEFFSGDTAMRIQGVIEQTSIYQKFSHGGNVYAVGYRPLVK